MSWLIQESPGLEPHLLVVIRLFVIKKGKISLKTSISSILPRMDYNDTGQ